MMRARRMAWCAAGLGLALAVAAGAEQGRGTAAEAPVYRPVMSDLMNSVIQPRHIKLFLGGEAQDWDYAEYERHNIGGALARIATAIPDYKGMPTADMIQAFATPQLAELEVAIKAKDVKAFNTAYEGLTAGCNGCHRASGHAMVAMQTPASDSFPDQVFDPPSQ